MNRLAFVLLAVAVTTHPIWALAQKVYLRENPTDV